MAAFLKRGADHTQGDVRDSNQNEAPKSLQKTTNLRYEKVRDFDGDRSECALSCRAVDGGHGVPIGVTRLYDYHDDRGEQQIGSKYSPCSVLLLIL